LFDNRQVGQRKRDKQYPQPTRTRWVWVAFERGRQQPPSQGLIIEWRRYRYSWWALCQVVVDEPGHQPMTVMSWIPVERLVPVIADPNDGRPRRLT
jgi:hypothetical protein